MTYLTITNLAKQYAGMSAVDGVSLSIEEGEAIALLGPSGCGKTTTLRMVAGLIEPTGGSVSLNGVNITREPAHRRNMGYVFQSYALFPHLNVFRNVSFGLEERGLPRAQINARVEEALNMVRLGSLSSRRPRELSGGQQQRVALARALVIRPAVFLLDESLSNLDAKLRDTMRQEIRCIQRDLGITTIFVTHDQVEALTMCDRIAVMNRGRVEQIGSPQDIYERPLSRFVASFVGRTNVLAATIDTNGDVGFAGVKIARSSDASPPLDLFIRPQRIRLTSVEDKTDDRDISVSGTVSHSVFIGEYLEIGVETGGGRINVELPSGQIPPLPGTKVSVVWRRKDTLVFPRDAA